MYWRELIPNLPSSIYYLETKLTLMKFVAHWMMWHGSKAPGPSIKLKFAKVYPWVFIIVRYYILYKYCVVCIWCYFMIMSQALDLSPYPGDACCHHRNNCPVCRNGDVSLCLPEFICHCKHLLEAVDRAKSWNRPKLKHKLYSSSLMCFYLQRRELKIMSSAMIQVLKCIICV